MNEVIYVHRCSFIPLPYVALAQGLASGLAGVSAAGMWSVALENATTPAGATHRIDNGCIQDTFAAMLPLDTVADNGTVTRLDPGKPNEIFAACQAMGSPVTLAQINGLLSSSLVADQDPYFLMQARNLRLMPEAM